MHLLYVSDPSNTTSHLSDPTTEADLRQVIRNYTLGGIDTVVQEIFAECMTMFWRTDLVPYDIRPHHQRMVPLMDAGTMPVEIYIDECHKQDMQFLAGFRMNDRHGHHPDYFKMLCEEKPNWVLREYKPSWKGAPQESQDYGCSLNYAVEGVRMFLLSIIEETVQRFDLDGIEFNYTRLVECFPREQTAESTSIMTDFIRQTRQVLDAKPGRHLTLCVRVPQQLEGCLSWGLDIPTWIREGLVDAVAPGDFGFTDFNEKWEDFTNLAKNNDCRIYPQTQPKIGIALDPTDIMTESQYRAALTNIAASGADGFSVQNHFFHWGRFTVGSDRPGATSNRFREEEDVNHPDAYPNPLKVLRTLKEGTSAGARHYTFLPLWPRGGGMSGIYEKEEILLRRSEQNTGTFRFRICEPLPSTKELGNALTIEVIGATEADQLSIQINGTEIPEADLNWNYAADPAKCTVQITDPPFKNGDNFLDMTLIESPGADGDIVVGRLDCHLA